MRIIAKIINYIFHILIDVDLSNLLSDKDSFYN